MLSIPSPPLADVTHLSNKTCVLQGLGGDRWREFSWCVCSYGDCEGIGTDGWVWQVSLGSVEQTCGDG